MALRDNLKQFANRDDFLKFFGFRSVAEAAHRVNKETACGGWLKEEPDGFSCGTIVEGSNAEISRKLTYPFTPHDWAVAWADIETFAHEEWHKANEYCGHCEDM